MYNKISSLILNSGKANGLSDVFIAQPDSLKESLAGKVFIIAEIAGKKVEGRKIFDFLISSLEENYYNDEKILLRDKIEGLKIENIFEAAISKTNKSLSEFLVIEKIKLNALATNLTIGVIHENKLYFSGFGKNRALLIYRHGEQYEVINVEANAADINPIESGDRAIVKAPSLFSSVISGEIPMGSYFVFASEALLEYVTGKDLINIITKLPPIVAAEQIKNILVKINTFIPFLGIIIKNTTGIDNQEIREETEENLTAHSSISSLNYTEQKTERMLAPAGLISFSKIYRGTKHFVKSLRPKPNTGLNKVYRATETEKPSPLPPDLGKIKSLNMARADSFIFKKKPNWIGMEIKKVFSSFPNLFSPRLWSNLTVKIREWLNSLNKKNRLLFTAFIAVAVILFISIFFTSWTHKQQAVKNNLSNLVTTIEEKQSTIDSYLLYNNEEGAMTLLIEARSLLNYLPQKKKEQRATYSRLEDKLNLQADKIQKIVKVDAPEKVNDLSGLQVNNIVWGDGKIYAGGSNVIYSVIPQSSVSDKFVVASTTTLSLPQFDGKSVIYYWGDNKLVKFDLKTNQAKLIDVSSEVNAGPVNSYKIFGGNLYVLAKDKNQIYKSSLNAGSYKTKSDWVKESIDLSTASDIFVDGRIYVLKNDGQVLKLYLNKAVDYKSVSVSPVMTGASKIIVGAKYIYIFEASSKRLAVLALEDGHLMNQYQVSSLNQLKDFAIDEKNKNAYFLDGEIVYKIILNQ